MQVSVEKLEGLERRITVQIPAEQIDPEVLSRLKSLSPTVKLPGFRPGKVPLKMVKRRYGEQVRQEVVSEVMRNTYLDAINQEKLRPVGLPQVEPKHVKEGEALEYSITFEILPEFDVTGIEELRVERPVVAITAADVDTLIDKLRQQRVSWNPVDRPAQQGDQVMIDFTSTGPDVPESQSKNVAVVLGEGQWPKEFEEKLTGLQAGAETELDINYPADYRSRELAGKPVHHQIKVNRVAEPVLPEVNEEFASSFGVEQGGVEKLRQATRENMERELHERIRTAVKHQLMEGLLAANPISVPRAMVRTQIDHMARQLGLPDTQDEKTALLKTQFEPEARQRIAFGLILSRLAEVNDIKVNETRVRTYLSSLASSYEQAAAVIQHYEKDHSAMADVRALVLEDQVVDWLLERIQVTDKPVSVEEIKKPGAAAPAAQK
jgi:trigger factor